MDWAFFFSKWLQFLWNFQRSKNYRSAFREKRREKNGSEIRVTFDNLEKNEEIRKMECKNVAILVNFWPSSKIQTDLRSGSKTPSDSSFKTSVAAIFLFRTFENLNFEPGSHQFFI